MWIQRYMMSIYRCISVDITVQCTINVICILMLDGKNDAVYDRFIDILDCTYKFTNSYVYNITIQICHDIGTFCRYQGTSIYQHVEICPLSR